MQVQKVIEVGNSWAITIPRALAERHNLQPGIPVVPQSMGEGIWYKPVRTKKISKEFDAWLKKTAKTYGPALKALAKK